MMIEKERAEFIKRAYDMIRPSPGMYSLDQALYVFALYFQEYEQHTGGRHPNIRFEQIRFFIERFHQCEGPPPLNYFDLEVDDYKEIIPAYFRTRYREPCDRNINHFMSGDIRFMKFLEECY